MVEATKFRVTLALNMAVVTRDPKVLAAGKKAFKTKKAVQKYVKDSPTDLVNIFASLLGFRTYAVVKRIYDLRWKKESLEVSFTIEFNKPVDKDAVLNEIKYFPLTETVYHDSTQPWVIMVPVDRRRKIYGVLEIEDVKVVKSKNQTKSDTKIPSRRSRSVSVHRRRSSKGPSATAVVNKLLAGWSPSSSTSTSPDMDDKVQKLMAHWSSASPSSSSGSPSTGKKKSPKSESPDAAIGQYLNTLFKSPSPAKSSGSPDAAAGAYLDQLLGSPAKSSGSPDARAGAYLDQLLGSPARSPGTPDRAAGAYLDQLLGSPARSPGTPDRAAGAYLDQLLGSPARSPGTPDRAAGAYLDQLLGSPARSPGTPDRAAGAYLDELLGSPSRSSKSPKYSSLTGSSSSGSPLSARSPSSSRDYFERLLASPRSSPKKSSPLRQSPNLFDPSIFDIKKKSPLRRSPQWDDMYDNAPTFSPDLIGV